MNQLSRCMVLIYACFYGCSCIVKSPMVVKAGYKTAHCPLLSIRSSTVQTDACHPCKVMQLSTSYQDSRGVSQKSRVVTILFFSISIENSNRGKKYQYIFLFTNIRKNIHFIALKFMLKIFFSGLIQIKKMLFKVGSSFNKSIQFIPVFSLRGPVPFKSLTSMVSIFSL